MDHIKLALKTILEFDFNTIDVILTCSLESVKPSNTIAFGSFVRNPTGGNFRFTFFWKVIQCVLSRGVARGGGVKRLK